jgi:putative ABC transport system permease protein
METLFKDIRYGLRSLLKQPAFTAIAIVTLALGIGANTAIFSVVNAVLLKPLPYEDPDRLVVLFETISGRTIPVSYLNFADWRDQSKVFQSVSAVRSQESFNLTGVGEAERLQGRLVSASFFSTLATIPIRGRDFLAEEDRPGAVPAVILSYRLWQRSFGADEGIIGRQLTLNNQSFTVVGIAPASFQFGSEADISVPIGLSAERFKLRGRDPGVSVVARLKNSITPEQAQAELNTIAARLEQQYPDTDGGRRVRIESLLHNVTGDVRATLLILLSAVGFVLLIACANVANLLLARSAARQKEIAIRTALGASRLRVIRQLLTESVLLALAGGAVGLLLAIWGTDLIISYLPEGIPRIREVGVDALVLGFTLAASLLTGIVFGLAPALQSSNPNLSETLKEGERSSSGRRQRVRGILVVSEVAMTLVLLVGAGLLVKSFWQLQNVDPGFNPRNLLTMQISVSAGANEGQRVANFFEELQQRVGGLPGVGSVSVSNGLPFQGANQPPFVIEGRPRPEPGKNAGSPSGQPAWGAGEPGGILYIASPGYFQTMEISLLSGRSFTSQDTRDSPPVAIIDEAFARQYFQNEDPIGKRLLLAVPGSASHEIVGVARHVEHFNLEGQAPVQSEVYFNFNQIPLQTLPQFVRRINLLVRSSSDPLSLAAPVRGEIFTLNKDQSVFNVRTMGQMLSQSVAARRFSMVLLSVFAALALALAAIGIYGVMSYAVAQRTREIGIRMALGAETGDVLKLVAREGLKLAAIGMAIGLAGAFALTRLMITLLFGVAPTDALTYTVVSLALISVSLLACYVPARRATKVDPLVALRYE